MIITGAPVELLDFEDVDYWDELCRIMAWSTTNVHSTLHICWGAQAGIYYHYGIPKFELPEKLSGVFEHEVVKPSSPLVRGFNDRFQAPHSRYTEVHADDIEAHPSLELIATSAEAGVYLAKSTDSRHFFVFGHPEYDVETLLLEYERDLGRGLPVSVPAHYFPDDDPAQAPHRHLARPCAAAVHQLAELLCLPDHALRPRKDRRGRTRAREGEASQAQGAAQASARLGEAQTDAASTAQGAALNAPQPGEVRSACAGDNPYLRPANEDDDGYDPYSDRREEPPLFGTGSVGLNRHHHCRGRWQHGIRRIGCLDPSAAIGRALHACTNIVG